MNRRDTPLSWIVNLFTIGIARAKRIAQSNERPGQGGAGFRFARFLQPFANNGLADQMNDALRAAGSSHQVSPVLCFFPTGWLFIGSNKRFRRGTQAYNDAVNVWTQAQAPAAGICQGL
ncbi:hypothetical protein [Nocardioides ungokensis]|uniref:hypothetical protein n=1 Tax=Nocardioides ungokensis TaxID=1643322 RepID=UPI0015DF73C2|nr:hypothetical protein [Nocardioides ungokensis]